MQGHSSDRPSHSPIGGEGAVLKSPIRWAGSKRRAIPRLLKLIPPEFGVYIEPFAGSASLLFALSPRKAVLGDINPDLIATWKAIRKAPASVYASLEALPVSAATYEAFRRSPPTARDSLKRAVRFLYLNRMCFNGVYRTNRRGQFNVPLGDDVATLPSLESLAACARVLRRARVLCADFRETVALAVAGDFVYLDPPYFAPGRCHYGEYGYGTFSEESLPDLLEALRGLDRRGVHVLWSYRWTPRLREALPGWRFIRWPAWRHVAGGTGQRRMVTECLAVNYESERK